MGDNGVRALPPLEAFNKRWKEAENGCWLWTGAVFNHGYGCFNSKFGGKRWVTTASRASYILHKGEIAEGLVVCHTCDNPLCVNPDHLFLGTDKDNVQDAIQKGRFQNTGNPCYQRGSDRTRAILTEDAVRAMRARRKAGERVTEIAKAYGIEEGTARAAINRHTWKHVA